MARTRAARGDGDLLRDELLDAAEQLLNEAGDERAVTIRAIVDRVGVTPPSLYRHFDSKEELIRQAVARRFGALARAIGEGAGPPAAAGDAAGALRGGCLGYLDWAASEPGGYALLFSSRRETLLSPDGPSGTEAFDALAGGIAGCQQAGVARDGDPQRMAMLVWAGLHGLGSLIGARPTIAWPPREQLVDDLLTGLVGLPPRG
ncbi:MAG: TetR/AcrR family transcriptional regulator [Nitriliruptoraceae bacterium]|nr:TetR/AcrR family transcriptional regulator [Nitriliruptoraceae bacterium]